VSGSVDDECGDAHRIHPVTVFHECGDAHRVTCSRSGAARAMTSERDARSDTERIARAFTSYVDDYRADARRFGVGVDEDDESFDVRALTALLEGDDEGELAGLRALIAEMVRALTTEADGGDVEDALRETASLLRQAAAGKLREFPDATIDARTTVRNTIALTPAFVVKTRDASGMKVFVNVCASHDVAAPAAGNDEWRRGLMPKRVIAALEHKKHSVRDGDDDALVFPLREGRARADVDSNANPCTVFDVAFNDVVLRHAEVYKPLKRLIAELSLRRCRETYGIALDTEYRLPARKFIGADPPPPLRLLAETRPSLVETRTVVQNTPSVSRAEIRSGIDHSIEFLGRPVTSVKLRVGVPRGKSARDVGVHVVREALTVDVTGLPSERIELPFMLDAESARGSCVDGGRTIECDVAYHPYDVAVDAARARLAKPTN